MPSTTQATYFADFLDTVWSATPDTTVEGSALADTLTIPSEGNTFPQHLSDDQNQADKVLLDMLIDDVPQSIIRSIVRSDSYDILVPPNPSAAPYIAISYANDTEEEYNAFTSSDCPSQDSDCLVVPGVTAEDFDEEEGNEGQGWSEQEWDSLLYNTVEFDKAEDLESSADLEDYFAVCDRRYQDNSNSNSLLDTSSLSNTTSISDSPSATQFAPFNYTPGAENWCVNVALRREELDSNLKLCGDDAVSELTQFSDPESWLSEF